MITSRHLLKYLSLHSLQYYINSELDLLAIVSIPESEHNTIFSFFRSDILVIFVVTTLGTKFRYDFEDCAHMLFALIVEMLVQDFEQVRAQFELLILEYWVVDVNQVT